MAAAALGYSCERRDQLDQQARLEEDEPAVAVVVGQRPERLVAQRDLGVEPPGPLDVRTRPRPAARRSRSIDAAHPVDGDLFHQELVDVLVGQLLDVLGVLVLSQHPDLLWAKAQPIPGPGLPRLGGAPPSAPGGPAAAAPGAAPGTRRCPARFALTEDAVDPGLRRRDRAAGRQPAPPVPDFRAGPQLVVDRWRAGAVGRGPPAGAAAGPAAGLRRRVQSPAHGRSSFGPDDVTVVVPVRDRPAQLTGCSARSPAWPASWSTTRRPMRRHQGDRRAPRRALRRAGHQRRPRGAPQRGAGPGRHAAGGVRRLRLRARRRAGSSPCWATSTTRWWRRWRRGSSAAAAERRVLARYEAVRSSLDRGRARGRCGPGARVPFVPSAALLVRADVADGPRPLRPVPARRRGRRPGVAPGRGRLGRPLRARERRRPRRAARRRSRSWPAGPSTGPRPRRWPGATATPWRRARVRLVAGRLAPRRWPAGPCWRSAALAAPSPSWPAACAGSCETPSPWPRRSPAVARRARRCRRWADWPGPGRRRSSSAGLPADPRRAGAGACSSRARRLGRRPEALDPVRYAALHVADDVAYGAGVWVGCARERTLVPLVPRVSWRARVVVRASPLRHERRGRWRRRRLRLNKPDAPHPLV